MHGSYGMVVTPILMCTFSGTTSDGLHAWSLATPRVTRHPRKHWSWTTAPWGVNRMGKFGGDADIPNAQQCMVRYI